MLNEYGADLTRSFARALGFGDQAEETAGVFRNMAAPFGWATRRHDDAPLPTTLFGHNQPFEYSLVLGQKSPALRLLVEAQADPPSALSYWRAGKSLSEWLEQHAGARLDRVRAVEDLFEPTDPNEVCVLAHGVSWTPGVRPEFKCYQFPAAKLVRSGDDFVADAAETARHSSRIIKTMYRLGFDRVLGAYAQMRAVTQALLVGFAFDLDDGPTSRVKLYLRLRDTTPEKLAVAATFARDIEAADVHEVWKEMLGSAATATWIVAYAYTERSEERPSSATLHLPTTGFANDAEVEAIVRRLAARYDFSTEIYDQFLDAVGREGTTMTHAALSFERAKGQPRFRVYLAPRAYR